MTSPAALATTVPSILRPIRAESANDVTRRRRPVPLRAVVRRADGLDGVRPGLTR